MLFAATGGELELRAAGDGSHRLSGSFPYNVDAVLSDGGRTGGRPRKERINSRAFAFRVNDPAADIHILAGHDYGRPLASRATDTLSLIDGDDAISFEATITRVIADTTWGRDSIAALQAGIVRGLSPGFRLPPPRAVPVAERVEQEPDLGPGTDVRGAIRRIILSALLYEFSLVTIPAYDQTQVELRDWNVTSGGVAVAQGMHAVQRWR